MQPWTWYLHRLRAMDVAEVWGRLREKLRHQTERLVMPAFGKAGLREAPLASPVIPPREQAPEALKAALQQDAARLLEGEWCLFGWKTVPVSSPPNWHRDSIREVSVPTDGRLNHRSLPNGADVRAIWEINRWAELVRLAMHGWVNDDAAAIRGAQEWLADWVAKNPVGVGINWTSALEGGLRLINFCWFDALVSEFVVRPSGRSDDDGIKAGLRTLRDAIVPAHVWWVKRYLSFGSSANNHRLGELTGLLLAVKRWPELGRMAGTVDELWTQIEACVLDQFAGDGGNREQALHYHLFAFEMALHACRAMNISGGPVMERLRKAAEFFARMAHPREPWDYGDSDDAQIVPLTMRRGEAVAEWCAWMKAADGVGQALPGKTAQALDYWLGDSPFRRSSSATPDGGWWIADESGMAVIDRDGWKLRVDGSPLGFGKMAAHGHCDALQVSIWDGEQALVIDPGTGGYFGAKELRAELAAWPAHNGPRPEGGFTQPRRMGTFLWSGGHARPVICAGDDDLAVRWEHEGFSVCRDIRFLGDGRVGIWDYEAGGRPLVVNWHLAPECSAHQPGGPESLVEIRRDAKRWQFAVVSAGARVALRESKASRSFGDVQPCPMIEVTGPGELRVEWRRVN